MNSSPALENRAPEIRDRAALERGTWMVLLAAFLGWMFDGMDMGVFPLVARPALIDMHGQANEAFIGLWNGRFNAWFLWGAACGGLIFGWLGDRIGRVRAMTWSILAYSLFTGLAYFARQPWHLGASRFIASLGMGGEWSLGVALVMEVWPERHRPLLAGVIGAAANVGFALIGIAGLSFPITRHSWRWIMLIGAAPALLTFFIRIFVPESRQWKKSVEGARPRPIREIFSKPHLRTTLLAIVFASVPLIVTWGAVQWLASWADKMAGPSLPKAKAFTQTLAAAGAVVGCLGGAWAGNLFGRRVTYFALCVGSLAACSYLFGTFTEYNNAFLAMSFVVGALTASFYGWMPLYLPELFPTRIRATGQGISYNFGRILAGFGALKMSDLMQQFHGDYARAGSTIVLIYLVGAMAIWFAPETRGKPLPD